MVRKVSDVARKRMSYTTTGVFIVEQPLGSARCNLSEFGTGQGHGLASESAQRPGPSSSRLRAGFEHSVVQTQRLEVHHAN
jgi:hypothetical protein